MAMKQIKSRRVEKKAAQTIYEALVAQQGFFSHLVRLQSGEEGPLLALEE